MAKRKVELELVKGDERSLPSLERVRELVKELNQDDVNVVVHETQEFFRARQAGMLSYLTMGEHLAKVRTVLEPKELWTQYANALPNMGIATAYRFIWAWENAKRALPVATLRVVARDGYKLISNEKGGQFSPKFEKAVKEVTREIGPPPEDNEIAAGKWVEAVVAKKRLLKRATPKDAHRTGMAAQVKRVVLTVRRAMKKLPVERRDAFLGKVMEQIAGIAGTKKLPTSVRAA